VARLAPNVSHIGGEIATLLPDKSVNTFYLANVVPDGVGILFRVVFGALLERSLRMHTNAGAAAGTALHASHKQPQLLHRRGALDNA
jgi:hypothetical protein